MISKQLLDSNIKNLMSNSYPGRGIIIGMTPDMSDMVQVYWIMGRSENSRNRIFENINGFVRTKAYDESKVTDPTLTIYYPIKYYSNFHIVSNGDQTETILNALIKGDSFENALSTRCYEPDPPNFTPRISALVDLKDQNYAYRISILKSLYNDKDFSLKHFYNYEKAVPGIGHCIHTYTEDGNPLPSFIGEPFEVELFDDICETAEYYWNIINKENRVSILVKHICIKSNSYEIKIINKHG